MNFLCFQEYVCNLTILLLSPFSEGTLCYQCDSWEHLGCGEDDYLYDKDREFLVPCNPLTYSQSSGQYQTAPQTCLKEVTYFLHDKNSPVLDPYHRCELKCVFIFLQFHRMKIASWGKNWCIFLPQESSRKCLHWCRKFQFLCRMSYRYNSFRIKIEQSLICRNWFCRNKFKFVFSNFKLVYFHSGVALHGPNRMEVPQCMVSDFHQISVKW